MQLSSCYEDNSQNVCDLFLLFPSAKEQAPRCFNVFTVNCLIIGKMQVTV